MESSGHAAGEGLQGFRELIPLDTQGPVTAFSAFSEALGRRVLVHRVGAGLFGVPESARRFIAAAQSALTLRHPNLSPPLALAALPDGGFALTSELRQGTSLAEHLQRAGPLLPEDVVQLAQRLCDGLGHAHQARVLHHGLRPEAVQLLGDGGAPEVRLCDFAVGMLPGGPGGAARGVAEGLAPECIRGAPPSVASDLYGLGAVLYAALTGHPPFTGATRDEVLRRHLEERPAPLPESAAHLGVVIFRCLEKDPAKRPGSAAEVAAHLSKANQTLVSTGARAPETGDGAPRRNSLPALPATNPRVTGEEKPGDTVGVYKLVGQLGEGAMGRVYLAQHALLGRQVALKILRPEQYKKEELIQRFFQEARTVNQINHEHIVEIIDFVSEAGPDGPTAVYCVMEYLQGRTLSQEVSAASLDLPRTLDVMQQVCDALGAAHKVGVVHRDVKPDNIFLTEKAGRKDYVKVLDFGVAKMTAAQGDAPLVSTMDGVLIGTPVCMSPEQASGQTVDWRTDIYAVGIVLYELLSGKLPFDAPNFGALAVQIVTQPPPPLPTHTPRGEPIPGGLARLVMRCLEKNPVARPQSMLEVRDVLRTVAAGGPVVIPDDAPPPVAPRSRAPWLVLGAVVLAAAGAGGWFALKPGAPVVVAPPPPVDPIPTPPPADPPPPLPSVVVENPVEPDPVEPDAPVEPTDPVTPPKPKPAPAQRKIDKLTVAEIAASMKPRTALLRGCLKQHEALLPSVKGQVKLQLQVDVSGKVTLAKLAEPEALQNTQLAACMERVGRQVRFPAQRTAVPAFPVPFAWDLGSD